MMEIMDKKILTLVSIQYWSNSGVQENSLLLELSLSHLNMHYKIFNRVVASSAQIVPKQVCSTVNANYHDL